MATEQQQDQAATYLRSLVGPPGPEVAARYEHFQRIHAQIETGVMRKLHDVGRYAARIVGSLQQNHIATDIELAVAEIGPGADGWTTHRKYPLGSGWILRETPAHFVPAHEANNPDAMDYEYHEVIEPPHVEPAHGWALLEDASVAPYYREHTRGEVGSYGEPQVYRFNEPYMPMVESSGFGALPDTPERLAILTVCGVDDPGEYEQFVTLQQAHISRTADSWANLFDRFVSRKGLQVSDPA